MLKVFLLSAGIVLISLGIFHDLSIVACLGGGFIGWYVYLTER